nr:putative integron gene cassette protein [uncultured bacterium]
MIRIFVPYPTITTALIHHTSCGLTVHDNRWRREVSATYMNGFVVANTMAPIRLAIHKLPPKTPAVIAGRDSFLKPSHFSIGLLTNHTRPDKAKAKPEENTNLFPASIHQSISVAELANESLSIHTLIKYAINIAYPKT